MHAQVDQLGRGGSSSGGKCMRQLPPSLFWFWLFSLHIPQPSMPHPLVSTYCIQQWGWVLPLSPAQVSHVDALVWCRHALQFLPSKSPSLSSLTYLQVQWHSPWKPPEVIPLHWTFSQPLPLQGVPTLTSPHESAPLLHRAGVVCASLAFPAFFTS